MKKLSPEERRERLNAYKRRYWKEHPEKVKQWRNDYIVRKATRILAEQAQGAQTGPREEKTTTDQQTAPRSSGSE